LSRIVRLAIAVAFVVLVAVALSNRLPAPAANGQARRCEIPAESARPLDLGRSADRAHLRADAATAESWAIAFADVSPLRKQGPGPYAQALDQCMATVFATLAERHAVDVSTVRAYAQQRNIVFDAAVLLAFALIYGVVAYHVAGATLRQLPDEARFAVVAAMIAVSAMTVLLTLAVGDMWSIMAETFRIGNGHLSYRTERLPWRQHRAMFIGLSLGVFWVVAVARVITRKREISRRPATFSAGEEWWANR